MKRNKKRICITLTAGILLALLYCVIFDFSGQDGETSGSLSREISGFCVELWNKISGGRMAPEMIEDAAASFEYPLRKAAHFCEYALMGLLVSTFLCDMVQKKGKRYALTVLWVFVSAALDEFHQYFIPGRCASMADALLDTCGGAFGALLWMGIVRLIAFFF